MASSIDLAGRATTPPATTNIRIPSAPKHGWEDDYQPYGPRKSARVSAQASRDLKTPPPQTINGGSKNVRAGKSTRSVSSSTPETAPKKTPSKASASDNGKKHAGNLTYGGMASAAASLGLPTPQTHGKTAKSRAAQAASATAMLPTPARTPHSRTTQATGSGMASVARKLFTSRTDTIDDAMPTPKRGRKDHHGFILDSASDEDQPIKIFTDSYDTIPEVDTSAANPFWGPSEHARDPSKGTTARAQAEREHREEGILYNFRGKKIFKKFADEVDDADVDDTTGTERRITRSSLKPRLLWPTPEQIKAREMTTPGHAQNVNVMHGAFALDGAFSTVASEAHMTDDEEEVTDIEDEAFGSTAPIGFVPKHLETPKGLKFGPATTPVSGRLTRSKTTSIFNDQPGSPEERNPFNLWQRTKSPKIGSEKSSSASFDSMLRAPKTPTGQNDVLESDESPTVTHGQKRQGGSLAKNSGPKKHRARRGM